MTDAPACDLLVLSPHLDDAALSVGGLIHDRARAGASVQVVTVFAGDPPPGPPSPLAADLRRWWGLGEDAEAARRAEDEAAMARLGAAFRHLELPEAPARRDAEGSALYPGLRELFRAPHPFDAARLGELSAALLALPPAREVLAPLGAGRHVDHVLLRRAAERAFGASLAFYEDFPYSRRWLALRRALGLPSRLRPRTVALSEPAVAARIAAAACYASQLRTLFGGAEGLERQIRASVRKRGGERLWRPLTPGGRGTS